MRKLKLHIVLLAVIIAVCNITYAADAKTINPYKWMEVENTTVVHAGNPLVNENYKFPAFEYSGKQYIRGGDVLVYKNVNFDRLPSGLEVAVGSEPKQNVKFSIHIDSVTSPAIATGAYKSATYTWYTPEILKLELLEEIYDTHDVYVNFTSAAVNFFGMKFSTDEMLSGGVPNYPDVTGTSLESSVSLLTQLEIIPEYVGIFDTQMPVTRIEFADILRKIYTVERIKPTKTIFTDIPEDDKNRGAVEYLYERGVVKGNGQGVFYPDRFVTPEEAAIMALRVLGYEPYFDTFGGYESLIVSTGLLKNIDVKDNCLRRSDVITFMNNVIEANFVDVTGIRTDKQGNSTMLVDDTKGILSKTRGIHKKRGVVNANQYTGLASYDARSNAGCVSIDNVEYFSGKTNASDLLGYSCNYYYTEEDGYYTLNAIIPQKRVEVFEISTYEKENELVSISNAALIYYENNRKINLPFNNGVNIIFNGKAIDFDIDDYFASNAFSGTIKVINNGNGYETVLIEAYENILVAGIDAAMMSLSDKITNTPISFDNCDIVFENAIVSEFEEIKKGMLLTVKMSINQTGKRYCKIYVESDTYVNGTVESYDNEYIVINGVEYIPSKDFTQDYFVGLSGNFYVNHYGEVVYYSNGDINGIQVGLLLAHGASNNNLDDNIQVKLLKADGTTEIFDLSKKPLIDGEPCGSFAAKEAAMQNVQARTPVRYKLNAENAINMLDTAVGNTMDENDSIRSIRLNGNEIYYASGLKTILVDSRNAAPILNNALLFVCPADINDERKMDVVSLSTEAVSGRVSWDMYSFSNDYDFVSVAVSREGGSAGSNDPGFLFEEIKVRLDDETGEEIYYLKGYRKGQPQTYEFHPSIGNDSEEMTIFKSLEEGDYFTPWIVDGKVSIGSNYGKYDWHFFHNATHSHTYTYNGVTNTITSLLNETTGFVGDYKQDWGGIYGVVDEIFVNGTDYIKIKVTNRDAQGNETVYYEYIDPSIATSISLITPGNSKNVITTGLSKNAIERGDTIFVNKSYRAIPDILIYR